MKKIIAMLLVLLMTLSSFVMAQSSESTLENKSISPMGLIANLDNFEVKEISFITIGELLSQKTNVDMSVAQFIKIENSKNVNEIKKFVKALNLKGNGQMNLEKQILNGLNELETKSGYIEKYLFYIPKTLPISVRSMTSPIYYGTYSNHEFREYFDVYTDAYQKHSYDTNKHQQWAEGIISFALNFAPKAITIPYTLLTLTNRNDIITFGTTSIRHDGSDEVTRHYITIKDLYNIMGAGSSEFYVTIVDEARTNTTDSVIDFASPTKQTVVDNISYMEPIYCSTWSNSKSSQMVRGYNQFYYDPGVPAYNLVGRFSIPW